MALLKGHLLQEALLNLPGEAEISLKSPIKLGACQRELIPGAPRPGWELSFWSSRPLHSHSFPPLPLPFTQASPLLVSFHISVSVEFQFLLLTAPISPHF